MGSPVQPLKEGTTFIVAVWGVLLLLSTVKDGISPIPDPTSPIETLSFNQSYWVPARSPVKKISSESSPEQCSWFSGVAKALGWGLTVMVNVWGTPKHPLYSGVTVIIASWSTRLVLSAIKDSISPDPDAASPIDVLSLVQIKLVVGFGPENITSLVLSPSQWTWSAGSSTIGIGSVSYTHLRAHET